MVVWPKSSRAAISFTYDDGRESQIDIAAVDLEEHGCRGTFFVTPSLYHVQQRAADWTRIAQSGHEIGNHSFTHCLAYDTPAIFEQNQIGPAEQWINDNIIYDTNRTYAYLGGGTKLDNGLDYTSVLEGVVLAARTGGGGPATAVNATAAPLLIPACVGTWGNHTADACIRYIEEASTLDSGWAVLVFHDIFDGEPAEDSQTSRKIHRQIIEYAVNPDNKFWVAPFCEVYKYATSHNL